MNKRQIDNFFKTLNAELQQDAGMILTGAAAGTIRDLRRKGILVFGCSV